MMKKPDSRIYQLLASRYGLELGRTVFIDDAVKNVTGAREAGMLAIHFKSAEQLIRDLRTLDIVI